MFNKKESSVIGPLKLTASRVLIDFS